VGKAYVRGPSPAADFISLRRIGAETYAKGGRCRIGDQIPFKLLALVLPLSLDPFAVSAALSVAGLSRRERWRLSLLLAGFEAVIQDPMRLRRQPG
jgi:hypothetical protein